MMTVLEKDQLFAALRQQIPSGASDWFETAQHQLHSNTADEAFEQYLKYSAMVKRKLGEVSLNCDWRVDQAARLLLLFDLLSIYPANSACDRIKEAFKCGDEHEQMVIIKGLVYLDEFDQANNSAELIDLAMATCRTNSVNLYAAIALNNHYPARRYDKRAYHQLVLKALFMGLDISQMIGLAQRRCPELSGLAIDLVNERLAANRPPPGGIWLAIDIKDLTAADLATYQRFNNK